MGICKVLLLERDVSEAPPSVIVRHVGLQSRLITLLAVFVVLICHKLMTAESVRIGEALIQLDGPAEEFKRRFMLFEQTVAITDDAPSFGGEERLLNYLIA